MRFCAVFGKARHGKDTCAEMVVDILSERGVDAFTYALASPLKECVNNMFGWGYEEAYGKNKEVDMEVVFSEDRVRKAIKEVLSPYTKVALDEMLWISILEDNSDIHLTSGCKYEGKISPRKAYQLFGTEFIRNSASKTFWLDIAEQRQSKDGRIMVISDVRFVNELEFFQNLGAPCFGVHRPAFDNGIGSSHASEKDIETLFSKVECTIINSKGLRDLRLSVLDVVETIVVPFLDE